ncbi:MAG: hypothetical protein Q8S73_08185 [Deltaproteobacteria bacterium]|nr:hypothetical protein [Myxococcales bacterium]MDP3214067.1 hypothetical protein [Deltaproteobacteria bacterium]
MRERPLASRMALLLALSAVPLAAFSQMQPTPPPGQPSPIQPQPHPPGVPTPPNMPHPPGSPHPPGTPLPPTTPPVMMPDAGARPFPSGYDAGGIRR